MESAGKVMKIREMEAAGKELDPERIFHGFLVSQNTPALSSYVSLCQDANLESQDFLAEGLRSSA